jgi:hypothetical protein
MYMATVVFWAFTPLVAAGFCLARGVTDLRERRPAFGWSGLVVALALAGLFAWNIWRASHMR